MKISYGLGLSIILLGLLYSIKFSDLITGVFFSLIILITLIFKYKRDKMIKALNILVNTQKQRNKWLENYPHLKEWVLNVSHSISFKFSGKT